MILPVRPHYLFDKVPFADRMVSIPVPLRQVGSPSLLETFLLIAVGKIIRPERIFEIGTFAGQTTRNLARNFPQAEVVTLDLDAKRSGLKQEGVLLPPKENRIVAIEGHSMNFNFSTWHGSCDLVFIDGGHDFATVKSDTENAWKLLRHPMRKITVSAQGVPQEPVAFAHGIVWHDYANPHFADVTKYLLERKEPIFHVLDTQLAVYLDEPANATKEEISK